MKKTFSLLFLMFFIGKAYSQSVVTHRITPKPNTLTVFVTLDSNSRILDKEGEVVLWDFSKVKTLDTNRLFYLHPKQTPYGDVFPQANLAMTHDNQSFDYFLFTDSAYYMIGDIGYDFDLKTAKIKKFLSPNKMLNFPILYGDSFSQKNTSYRKFVGRFDLYQNSMSQNQVAGQGVLMLPIDTFGGVLRQTIYTQLKDSFVAGEKSFLQSQTETKHLFFTDKVQAPILSLTMATVNYKDKKDTSYSAYMGYSLSEKKDFDMHYFKHSLAYNKENGEFYLYSNGIKKNKCKVILKDTKGKKLGKTIKLMPDTETGLMRIPDNIIFDKYFSGVFVFHVKEKRTKSQLYFVHYPVYYRNY
jgi:hypothetical protein